MASGPRYTTEWTHGPVSGPVNGFLGAVVLAALGQFLRLPWWVPLAPAALGCLAAVAMWRRHGGDVGSVLYRAGCWAGAGAWAAWAMVYGWSLPGVLTLVFGAVAAGLLAPAFGPRVVREVAGTQEPGRGIEAEWVALIRKACGIREPGLRVRKIEDWPGRTGYTLEVEFPPGTTYTWRTLRDAQVGLAAAKRLPPGCPINAAPSGAHQGAALAYVSTVNDMAADLPFPADYGPVSIVDEFDIGRYRDGRFTMVEVYQSAAVIAGKRGGGKTVILQVITGQAHRAVDAVIWHVDLNGGGMSAPWLLPFAEGEIDSPTVDWVATSPAEAILMARVGTAIAKDRKRRYQRLMAVRNVDILPVSPELPEIIIMVDEGGEVTGDEATPQARMAARELRELQRIGRAMCVNVIFSVQRATSDYVPSQMKKGTSLDIMTKVKDAAEIAHLFDWQSGLRVEDLTHPGCAFIRREEGAVLMYKGYALLPRQIRDVVLATAHLRPKLDAAAAAVGGQVYAQRWERREVRAFLAGLAGGDVEASPVSVETAPSPEPIGGVLGGTASAIARARDLAAGGQAPKPRDPATMTPAELAREVESIAALEPRERPEPKRAEPEPAPEPEPEPKRDAQSRRREYIKGVVDRAGAQGIETKDVISAVWNDGGFTCRRQTVSEDLAALKGSGPDDLASTYGRWFTNRHAAR